MSKCAQCGKVDGLNVCSGCKGVAYCSKEHQKEHWGSHKAVCKLVALGNKSGFHKVITKEAPPADAREPRRGSLVTVHYTGTLPDGSKFDSSRDAGQPFQFLINRGEVIKGWDEGVLTMKIGERAMLYLSSSYGYGASGSPPDIPPNYPLIFDVEVLAAEAAPK